MNCTVNVRKKDASSECVGKGCAWVQVKAGTKVSPKCVRPKAVENAKAAMENDFRHEHPIIYRRGPLPWNLVLPQETRTKGDAAKALQQKLSPEANEFKTPADVKGSLQAGHASPRLASIAPRRNASPQVNHGIPRPLAIIENSDHSSHIHQSTVGDIDRKNNDQEVSSMQKQSAIISHKTNSTDAKNHVSDKELSGALQYASAEWGLGH